MTEETQVAAETQNPAELTNEAPEVVTPEVDPTQQTSETPEDEAAKSLKRMQRRIDKRTADVYRERAEKEQLAQRITELESRLQPQQEPAIDPKQLQSEVQKQAREIARLQVVNEKCNAIAAQGKKEFPDFDAALSGLAAEAGALFDARGRPLPLMDVILEADAPAKLLHYLGTNPDVAAELADLTPTQLARRLDRIEREMTSKPKTSNAPKPLEPVKGHAGSKDPSQMTDAEFAAWRREQIKKR